MSSCQQVKDQVIPLIKSFRHALKKYYTYPNYKKYPKYTEGNTFYEQAKKAQTQERNLLKALQLYLKSIQSQQKKDSTIKDFASTLHQLGFTKQAVKFMDDCQSYYDGNKNKYFRLRENLEIQIRPTGKHLCRFLLIQNICQELKALNEEKIKESLFKSPKRIKAVKFFQNFDLQNQEHTCPKQLANFILVEFQSFSAAKKTLQSFCFEQWFGSNLYWINMTNMRIVCSAQDGKRDFEEGFIVSEQILNEKIFYQEETFWRIFGQEKYQDRMSNGFLNLLASHLIRENALNQEEKEKNKENIFESSKIKQGKISKDMRSEKYDKQEMDSRRFFCNTDMSQSYNSFDYYENIWGNFYDNGNYYYY